MADGTAVAGVATRRPGSPARVATWTLHVALPVGGLWLLLARPQADLELRHGPVHLVLVTGTALVSVAVALAVNEAARRRRDARLVLVGLGFLAAAGFLALHGLATPDVLVSGPNVGFSAAAPAGLLLAAVAVAAAAAEPGGGWAAAVLRRAGALRAGLLALVVAWGVVALVGPPPPAGGSAVLRWTVAAAGVALYAAAAVGFFRQYRRRPGVVLLSVITACVLLGEALAATALARSWHLSWWTWHLLMALAFGFVAYSAHVQYRREGVADGLFDGVASQATAGAVRAGYGAALEAVVAALRRGETGAGDPVPAGRVAADLGERFGLSEGQAAVLGRAAEALAGERAQLDRLRALVEVGRAASVVLAEPELLRRALAGIAAGFAPDAVSVALLDDGRFTPGPGAEGDLDSSAAQRAVAAGGPVDAGPSLHAVPLTVKGRVAGVVVLRRTGGPLGDRDRALAALLASQLSIVLENARLYRRMDVLFRQYLSPDLAAALIADPAQAALGGEVVEVTVLFADLRGFTAFAETNSPEEVVALLNRYFAAATRCVLAEGGTVVQYVGDAMLAVFGAPARHPDHARRAARAALAVQRAVAGLAGTGLPGFRIGVNSGPALVGNIGSEQLRSFNAQGDAVNVAARLEMAAEPGQVLVGAATREALGAAAEVEPLGELTVKGRARPVTAYVLRGLR